MYERGTKLFMVKGVSKDGQVVVLEGTMGYSHVFCNDSSYHNVPAWHPTKELAIRDALHKNEVQKLRADWPREARVWLNPPYGPQAAKWLRKLLQHGNGLALVFARTETRMFRDYVWDSADAVVFMFNRLTFHHVDGSEAENNSGAPSALVAYGRNNAARLYSVRRRFGMFIDLAAQRRTNDNPAASHQRLL